MVAPMGSSGDKEGSGRFMPGRSSQCQSSMEHEELCERLRKTLYYGKMPSMDCPSLAMTELTVELLQDVSEREFGKVDMYYAAELSREVCASPCSVVVAMLYMRRLQKRNPAYLHQISSSELLLVTMMMASKYLYDEGEMEEPLNDEWANSANIDVAEINLLERAFLSAIDWKLYVSRAEYWNALMELETRIAWKRCWERGGSATYTDLSVLLGNGSDLSAAMLSVVCGFCEVLAVCCVTYCVCLLPLAASPSALIAVQPLALSALTLVAQVPHLLSLTAPTILSPGIPLSFLDQGLESPPHGWLQAAGFKGAELSLSGLISGEIFPSSQDLASRRHLAGTNRILDSGAGTNWVLDGVGRTNQVFEMAAVTNQMRDASAVTNQVFARIAGISVIAAGKQQLSRTAAVTNELSDDEINIPVAATASAASDVSALATDASAAVADATAAAASIAADTHKSTVIPTATKSSDLEEESVAGDHFVIMDVPGALVLEWVCLLLTSAVSTAVNGCLYRSLTDLQKSCSLTIGWNSVAADVDKEDIEGELCFECRNSPENAGEKICRRSGHCFRSNCKSPEGRVCSTCKSSKGHCVSSKFWKNSCNGSPHCNSNSGCSSSNSTCSRSRRFSRRVVRSEGNSTEDFAPFGRNFCSFGESVFESQSEFVETFGYNCSNQDVNNNGSFSCNFWCDNLEIGFCNETSGSCCRAGRSETDRTMCCIWCTGMNNGTYGSPCCNACSIRSGTKDRLNRIPKSNVLAQNHLKNGSAGASTPEHGSQHPAMCSKSQHCEATSAMSIIKEAGCRGVTDNNCPVTDGNCNGTYDDVKDLGLMNKGSTLGSHCRPAAGLGKSLGFGDPERSGGLVPAESSWMWKQVSVIG